MTMAEAALAPQSISSTAICSIIGAPCPPWSADTPTVLKPCSQSSFQASLI